MLSSAKEFPEKIVFIFNIHHHRWWRPWIFVGTHVLNKIFNEWHWPERQVSSNVVLMRVLQVQVSAFSSIDDDVFVKKSKNLFSILKVKVACEVTLTNILFTWRRRKLILFMKDLNKTDLSLTLLGEKKTKISVKVKSSAKFSFPITRPHETASSSHHLSIYLLAARKSLHDSDERRKLKLARNKKKEKLGKNVSACNDQV